MTIYTSASRTHKPKYDICENGIVRTKALLDRLGLEMDSLVPMGLILDELGLSDCLFSFCEVAAGGEREARAVLLTYMQVLLDTNSEYLYRTDDERIIKPIQKRILGLERAAAKQQATTLLSAAYNLEPNMAKRKGIDVLRCLTSDHPDYLAVLHGGVHLMDGAAILGKRDEVHGTLSGALKSLLT